MSVKITPRYSTGRGHSDHGWLKSFHTFSFAVYHDGGHDSFGSLRVINEDRVEPKTGFGTHPHREFEIFSYVVSGELEHRDSMGNVEVLKRGDLQLTSAGTGIRHSEHTHGARPVHFLQIWAIPHTARLPPRYFTRHIPDAAKADAWAPIVAPVGAPGVHADREADGPAPVHSPVYLHATLLSAGKSLPHAMRAKKAYLHVVQTSGYNPKAATGAKVKVVGGEGAFELSEGDGAYVLAEPGQELKVENIGDRTAEVLLFDVDVE